MSELVKEGFRHRWEAGGGVVRLGGLLTCDITTLNLTLPLCSFLHKEPIWEADI